MPAAIGTTIAGFTAVSLSTGGAISAGALAFAEFVGMAAMGLTYGGAAYGLSMANQALNRPSTAKAGSPNFGADDIYNTSSTVYPIPIGYGKFKMGGNIIRKRVFGAEDGRLHMVVGLCEGVIESIADPDLNDKSWLEMTKGVTFDEVQKYYGTDSQIPDHHFMEGTAVGSWAAAVFTISTYSITAIADEGTTYYKNGWKYQVRLTTSAAHDYEEGDTITISGAGQSVFNGNFEVMEASDSTHFDILIGSSFPGTDTGSVRSKRSFKTTDENSYFITGDGFYLISTKDSTTQITCATNGSGNHGSVDRTKKYAKVYGTWSSNVFTRNATGKRGRRFQFSDEGGWLETDNGEWAITAVSEDRESVTCSGVGHAGTEGRVDETGFSQAYRGIAYLVLQIRASNKIYGDVTVTSIVEGKKCLCQGRPPEDSFEYAITGGMSIAKLFYIAENVPGNFPAGSGIYVQGSTANDGYYTIVMAVWDGSKTIIVVNEAIPSSTYDGEIVNYKYSNNPGIIVRDFLTTKVGIDYSDIDDTSFNVVIDYCDEQVDSENRYELDILVDEQKPVMDIIQDMLLSFGGALIYSEDKIKLLVEKSEASDEFDFTESNIVEGSFSFWRPEEHINRVKISYLDSSANYRSETVVAEDEDDIEINGPLEREISAPFITRTAHASRFCQMMLDKAATTDFLCRLTGSYETSILEVFDVVSVTHSLAGWTSKRFRILSVDKHEDGTNTFMMEAYDGNIYHDNPAETQTGYYSELPSPAVETELVENLTLTERGYTNEDGTWQIYIEVTFDDMYAQNWQGANIYFSTDSEDSFELAGIANSSPFRIWNMRKGDTVYVRALSVTIADNESDFDDAPTANIALIGKHSTTVPSGENEYPSDVVDIDADNDGHHCRLYWEPVDMTSLQNADLCGYEVRDENANFGTDDAHLIYRGMATEFTIEEPGAADAGGPFYIRAFNTSGIYSNSSANVSVTNSTPGAMSGVTYDNFVGGVNFRWTPSTERDHKDYKVRFKVDNGSGGSWGSYLYVDEATYTYKLTAAQITSSGSDAHIYIDIADRDIYLQVGNNTVTSEQSEKMPDALFTDWSMDFPILDGVDWSVDGAGVDYTAGILTYKGEQVAIADGTSANITEKYIYADLASPIADPLTFSVTDDRSTISIGGDVWLFAYHDDTIPDVYPVHADHIIHAGILQADSITANEMIFGSTYFTLAAGKVDVYNADGTPLLVTSIGDLGGGAYGLWMREGGVGGTSYANRKLTFKNDGAVHFGSVEDLSTTYSVQILINPDFGGVGYLSKRLYAGAGYAIVGDVYYASGNSFSGFVIVDDVDAAKPEINAVVGTEPGTKAAIGVAATRFAFGGPRIQAAITPDSGFDNDYNSALMWSVSDGTGYDVRMGRDGTQYAIIDRSDGGKFKIPAECVDSGEMAIARLGLLQGAVDLKFGSYQGDGATYASGGKDIEVAVGWQPDFIWVLARSDSVGGGIKTPDTPTDYAHAVSNNNYKSQRIDWDADGFTVYQNATEPTVNSGGVFYDYIAIKVVT